MFFFYTTLTLELVSHEQWHDGFHRSHDVILNVDTLYVAL